MRELTMDETYQVSGGVGRAASIAISVAAIAVGSVGVAVFGPEVAAAAGAWEFATYAGLTGASGVDVALGGIDLDRAFSQI